MRPRHHTRGPAWAINLGEAPVPAAPEPVFALDLPIEQRFALVYLRRDREGPDSLPAQIIRRLNDDKVPFPVGRHWHELRREGYVTFVAPNHVLTPKGRYASTEIMKDFAFRFSIHVFRHERGPRSGTWTRCSCGTWSSGPHNNDRFGEGRIHTAQKAHIRDVDHGIWPTRTLSEHLNRVDPLKLDLVQATTVLSEQATRSPGQGSQDH